VTVTGIDHVAVPCHDPVVMMEFYAALGFVVPPEDQWRETRNRRLTIHCGQQKINLLEPTEWQNPAFILRGESATPGCSDLCFVWDGSVAQLHATLEQAGATVLVGPVERFGGRGPGTSSYTRDPEGNLLEFIVY
jgi:catechol 2,3-dioxygenase-like lactoylglutathione lyase family enzyme